MRPRLSERERLIVALLKTYGPSPESKIIRVVFPGQEVFFARQGQYLTRTLRKLEKLELIEGKCGAHETVWKATGDPYIKSLFERTIEKYGGDIQLEVVVEECAELIMALQKYKRMKRKTPNANVTLHDIIGEAVDVEIMIEQMKHIFPYEEAWKQVRKAKLERMERRLSASDRSEGVQKT